MKYKKEAIYRWAMRDIQIRYTLIDNLITGRFARRKIHRMAHYSEGELFNICNTGSNLFGCKHLFEVGELLTRNYATKFFIRQERQTL